MLEGHGQAKTKIITIPHTSLLKKNNNLPVKDLLISGFNLNIDSGRNIRKSVCYTPKSCVYDRKFNTAVLPVFFLPRFFISHSISH